jgi:hypothetical protein
MKSFFEDRCKKLGMALYKAYNAEDGQLVIEYAKNVFWGQVIKDFLPVFEDVWSKLLKGNHYKNNPFWHGDADYSVWIEKPKASHRKVIVSICHCSGNGNDTHIFIQDKSDKNEILDEWIRFRIATAWDRQVSRIKGHKFGDLRDIIKPSLRTFRDFDFSPLSRLRAEAGHILFYDSHFDQVENSHVTELYIPSALQTLDFTLKAFEDN